MTIGDFRDKEGYCDFIMIGRGLLHNPFLPSEILENKIYSKEDLKNCMIIHLNELVLEYGEHTGVSNFRKHFAWYLHNVRNAKYFRENGYKTSAKASFEKLIYSL